MERIKLAVERARHQRQNLGLSPIANSTSIVPTTTSFCGSLSEYTQTKKFDIDIETYHNNRIISGVQSEEVKSAYKMLRTQVLRRMSQNNWNSLAISSPGLGEGKTLTSINLAISLAKEVNHTVLLVDLNLSNPCIAKHLDFNPQLGIDDYLLGDAALSEIMINPNMPRLVILPARRRILESSDILSSPKLVSLIIELKNRYKERIILFDLPPISHADDVLVFSSHVDASLIVIEEGKTQEYDLLRAINLLKFHNIIGTVINKSTKV